MLRSPTKRYPIRHIAVLMAIMALGGTVGMVAHAQPAASQSAKLLEDLRTCKALSEPDERLICYDAKTGALLDAADTGDARIVDREEVRQTRRQLFGISVPDIAILRSDDKDPQEQSTDMLETTIQSGQQIGLKTWRLTTIEGAVWEINNPPRKIASINRGDKVVFKRASLGYYFIRINGRTGVKGRRVL